MTFLSSVHFLRKAAEIMNLQVDPYDPHSILKHMFA
jgi:hypothetical protein